MGEKCLFKGIIPTCVFLFNYHHTLIHNFKGSSCPSVNIIGKSRPGIRNVRQRKQNSWQFFKKQTTCFPLLYYVSWKHTEKLKSLQPESLETFAKHHFSLICFMTQMLVLKCAYRLLLSITEIHHWYLKISLLSNRTKKATGYTKFSVFATKIKIRRLWIGIFTTTL